MQSELERLCAMPPEMRQVPGNGLGAAIYPGSVYRCADPAQAERLLAGDESGYVYQRDGHPNADWLATKLARMHRANWAVMTSSGMAALAAATLAVLQSGDHVLVSDQLYGRSTQLLVRHWQRLGVTASLVDALDVAGVQQAILPTTRMLVVETISNPLLRVVPLAELARLTRSAHIALLVDNTFASPMICRPLEWGADLVMESVSKAINGHSDVMLGVLAGADEGRAELGGRPARDGSSVEGAERPAATSDRAAQVRDIVSAWGLASSPFDCWLAMRGLGTLHLRMERASENAVQLARQLESRPRVARVLYPGLPSHPDYHRARELFDRVGHQRTDADGDPIPTGSILTFELTGGRLAVEQFLKAAPEIPFCPSLGELSTTVSHPASTSHRALGADERQRLGITEGTLRLSVGTEPAAELLRVIDHGLNAVT